MESKSKQKRSRRPAHGSVASIQEKRLLLRERRLISGQRRFPITSAPQATAHLPLLRLITDKPIAMWAGDQGGPWRTRYSCHGRLHCATCEERLRRGDCLCKETSSTQYQQRAVIGRGCCSTGRRLPQFKQANTVMTRPALRSTARSYNIVPWHLSQVFIISP